MSVEVPQKYTEVYGHDFSIARNSLVADMHCVDVNS